MSDRVADLVLPLLYRKKFSSSGLSTASAADLAAETAYAPCCILGALARLAAAGKIVIARPFLVLLRWRWWSTQLGGFRASPRAVPRHAAKYALRRWPKMPTRAREAYLASCALADVDELKQIAETKVGRCA